MVVDTEKDVVWEELEATPLYLPFYVAKYEVEGRERTLIMEATNEEVSSNALAFPTRPADSLLSLFFFYVCTGWKLRSLHGSPGWRIRLVGRPFSLSVSSSAVSRARVVSCSPALLPPLRPHTSSAYSLNPLSRPIHTPRVPSYVTHFDVEPEDLPYCDSPPDGSHFDLAPLLESTSTETFFSDNRNTPEGKLNVFSYFEAEAAVMAEKHWCWAVTRSGDDWLDRRGVREEVSRLSLEGRLEGEEEGVGRIVKWVGAEEGGEEED